MAGSGAGWSATVWLSITGLLIFGTMTTVFSKTMYQVYGYGLSDPTHPAYHTFQKPWAGVLIMFMGMSWCLVIHETNKKKVAKRQTQAALAAPLLGVATSHAEPGESTWSVKSLFVFAPAIADLIATVLMYLGLVHITASVYQMLRGAELVFAAIFSVTFLKRKLNRVHCLGIVLNVAGVSLVGLSSILSGSGQKEGETVNNVIFGMGLVVLSQMVQAVQLTFEDYFMADLNMKPMQVVGLEGMYGMVVMAVMVLPAVYFLPGPDVGDRQENSLDSFELVKSSNGIAMLVLAQMGAMLCYNFAGMCVTDNLGAVFRTILETTRTLFVWAVDCVLFYGFPDTGLGEGLTKYSYLQAIGFAVLVLGTLVYDKGDWVAARRAADAAAAATEDAPAPPPSSLFSLDDVMLTSAASVSQPMAFSTPMPAYFNPSMSLNAHSLSRASYMSHVGSMHQSVSP